MAYTGNSTQKQPTEQENELNYYKKILLEKYPKGFRIESGIEMKKFRNFWEQKYGKTLEEDDETIRKYIRKITIQYNDFTYLPEQMLDEETRKKLLSYIAHCFSEDKKVIYFDALYNEFRADFQNQRINNEGMLKAYLSNLETEKYIINSDCITENRNVEIDITNEIRKYLISCEMPIKIKDLVTEFSHISRDKILWAVAGNNSHEFVRNRKGEYFHADIVDLNDTELNNITKLIRQAIEQKDFISESELVEIVLAQCPEIKERYPYLTDLGMRNAIKYKLRDKFSFKGKIVSNIEKHTSVYDVFANYAKSHEHFTLAQLNTLKEELNTFIYFEAIYENSIRVSREEFVSKESVKFDIDAADEAISRFCTGDYITFREFCQFGSFPYVGFTWNEFLLEQYVFNYSKKYRLMHSGFTTGAPVGAIVKYTSEIKDFNELLTNVLADSTISLNRQDALQYLHDNGFLAKRAYGDIEQILIKANMQRLQKG